MRGLGAQLEAVFTLKDVTTATTPKSNLQYVAITTVTPNPYIIHDYTAKQLTRLEQDIRRRGLLQPLIVRQVGALYQILSGNDFYYAAKRAELLEVPVAVTDTNEHVAKAFSLLESLKAGQNPITEAEIYLQLVNEFAMTHTELAKLVGKSRTHISNLLGLLSLTTKVLDRVRQGKIDMAHARYLVRLKPQDQVEFAARLERENLSVRDLAKAIHQCADDLIEPTLRPKISVPKKHNLVIRKKKSGYQLHCEALSKDELDEVLNVLVK